MNAEASYDRYAAAYRDWWAPVIAPSATALLDDLEEFRALTALGGHGAALPEGDIRIVDIGAGTGTLSLAALERWPAARVVGVDPSRRMLEEADAEARRRSLDGRFETRLAEAARLPFADGSFDAAISSFVIQLLPSRAAAVREAWRVLRPGGIFACVTWRAGGGRSELEKAFEEAADELGMELPAPPGRDPRPYGSAGAAAAELRRAGFRTVRARERWLEHRYTPDSYVDMLEHWIEDDVFDPLDEPMRRQLRAGVLRRLEQLDPAALVWRRPLISVVGRRAGDGPATD